MCRKPIYLAFICMMGLAPVACGELVGWWTFDEGTGNTVLDSSGNGYTGTFQGDPEWVPGIRDGALELDGDDWVDFGNPAKLEITEEISIGCWVKPAVLGGQHGFVGRDAAYSFKANGTQLRFTTPGILDHNGTRSPLVIGEWQHVVATFKPSTGGGLIFYINGVETERLNSSAMNAGTGPFRIGSNQWSEYFTGQIDDVRVYNHILSVSEIKELAFRAKAYGPTPADGTPDVVQPLLTWKPGSAAVFHDVYFGTTPELTEVDLKAPRQMFAMYYHAAGLVPGTTYYWRIDEIAADGTVYTGDVWHFTAMPVTAYAPSPADEAEGIFPSPTLKWQAGLQAAQHQVYFSSDSTDVEGAAPAADQGTVAVPAFSPGVLRASTTYYWRVDEVKGDGSAETGPVWSFTTADGVAGKIVWEWWSGISGTAINALTSNPNYPDNPSGSELVDAFESAVDWADNYGQRLYGWLTPPETGDYTFWIAGDDAQELWLSTDDDPANAVMIANVPGWTPAGDFDNTGGGAGDADAQMSDPIPLQAGQKYFIMALGKEGSGGDSTAAAWQGPGIASREVIPAQYVDTFALASLHAFSPDPADGAVDTLQAPVLSWQPGAEAQQHEVYFGDDKDAVEAADTAGDLFQGRQAGTTYDAGDLEWGKTYYWRIDEVGVAETWKGTVWSFATANFIPVDDVESYTDDEGSRIYETWIDGYTDGLSGSIVGNFEAPFAEQVIVHGGKQSMPFEYNNVDTPWFSEAYREFSPVQDWTVNGVDSLSLWVHGNPPTFLETAEGNVTVSSTSGDVWDVQDHMRLVYKRLSGDGSVVVRVDSMTNTAPWAKAGVMIRETLEPGAAHALMMVAPNGRTAFQNRPVRDDFSLSAHGNISAVTFPHWVKLERKANQFTAYHSDDGANWVLQTNEGGGTSPNPQTINMAASVYVGLAVTSNNLNQACIAEFSGFATTGNVSGEWQAGDIGPAIVGNDVDTLYAAVEDSAGKSAVAVHPDPGAVVSTEWTEWKIPLSSFAGVNLARVEKLYIGVGDRANPTPDGTGRIYIDDIRVTRP